MVPAASGGGGVAAAAACCAIAGADADADAASASGRTYLRILMLSLRVNGKLPPTVSISCATTFLINQSKTYSYAAHRAPYVGAPISDPCPSVVRRQC